MKKLISLVMVLALVLGMATVALAEEPALGTVDNPIVVTDPSELASVDIPGGTIIWYSLPAEWAGMNLTFSAPMSGPTIYAYMYGMEWEAAMNFMSASYTLEGDGWNDILIGLGSAFNYDIYGGTCVIEEPVLGSEQMPAELLEISNNVVVNCIETADGPAYFMTWTNYGEGGNLVLNGVTGNFDVVEMNYVPYWYDSVEPISVGVPTWSSVNIVVRGQDLDDIVLDLSFEPFAEGESEYTPIEIPDQDKTYTVDLEIKAGTTMYYMLSDVNGAIFSIADPNVGLDFYGDCYGEPIESDDENVTSYKVETWGDTAIIGVYTYDGEAANVTISVSEPEGYDENPVILESLDSLNAEVEGGLNDVFYFVWNAPAAGKVTLGITGADWTEDALSMTATEWEYIYDEAGDIVDSYPIAWDDVKPQLTIVVNGEEVMSGTDVMFDVEADDVVIIKVRSMPIYEWDNYGYGAYIDAAGTFDPVGSMNNPIVVNSASELSSISVPAGEQVYIAISSMLNGQILTIAGDENTSVATRFGAVAGTNGVFAAELTGVPSNMFVVSNNGSTDATYMANIGPVALVDVITQSQATLEAMLQMDFTINKNLLTGTDNYAVITHTYANGSTDVVTIPQSQWASNGLVSYSKIAAKEMGDSITIVIYNAQGQQVSIPKTDSIKAYAFRGLAALADYNTGKNAVLRTLLVDMLNYGAAAQVQFGYDTANLVNADLTDAQKAWATQNDVAVTNNQIKDEATYNTTLVLESAIELDCIFYASKIGAYETWSDLYAIATYVDHNGKPHTVRIEGEDFIKYNNSSSYALVPVIGMAVADYQSIVTCVVYDANDNALATAIDSVEGYAYRALASGRAGETLENLCKNLMKFSASADAYFAK